jgi:hypothetical protein
MPTLLGLSTRLWSLRRPEIERIYYTNGGLGDELILTAIAAAARAAGQPIHVIVTYPELWQGNTDPASLQHNLPRWLYAELRGWIKTKVVHLTYSMRTHRSIAEQMAEHAGVKLPLGWRPVFNLDEPVERTPRRIVFHNSCRGARYAATTKEWPQDRWNTLIGNLVNDFELIQIGTRADPPVAGTQDWRGKTTLAESFKLLASAQLFIGLESGLMHVAAAVSTPAVIIVGGRSRPEETCYPFNHNITRSPDCVGCGINNGCPHALMCLDIPVNEVEAAIRSQLTNHQADATSPAVRPENQNHQPRA